MELSDKIESLKGIGDKTAALYHRAGVFSLWELLMYIPRDYMRYPEVKRAGELRPGALEAVCLTISAEPTLYHARSMAVLNAVGSDGTGSVRLTWFNMPYLKKNLRPGLKRVFFGKAAARGESLILEHPKTFKEEEYEKLKGKPESIYPLVKGLTQNSVRKALNTVLKEVGEIEDYLEANTLERLGIMPLDRAIRTVHEPENAGELIEAKKRLAFDEFLRFMLSVRKLKEKNDTVKNGFKLMECAEAARLMDSLPFKLTGAQLKAYRDCLSDMEGERAMMRLIQGDVGSGKTVVALLCLITAAANGYQGAMMAPTEVLASQHQQKISKLLKGAGLNIRSVLLTGSMTEKEKREARELISSGEAGIVIGTHALIQDKVEYKNLALVVTDEQHRFGVNQRESLAGKASGASVTEEHGGEVMSTNQKAGGGEEALRLPHVLVMSATPIPRTLAIILYGDLDITVMDEKPEERQPIKNALVDIRYRKKAYDFIRDQVKEGHQGYIICPAIEASEMIEMENVLDYSEKLRGYYGDGIRLGILHGKLKAEEKDRVMGEFAAGNIDVLVSTTVVEVGVDVPNATVMLIEDAQRFGLAQLHQLRGRIGRGDAQSYCIFVNTQDSDKDNERLKILKETNDGFKIASEDLKLRGPGDMFGIRQSGELGFKIADIYNDADMLELAAGFASSLKDSEAGRLSRVFNEKYTNEKVTL